MTATLAALSTVAAAALALAGLLCAQLARTGRELAAARHAAGHDRLTGLANRAGLTQAWPRLAGEPARAVLLLDLDGFKPVNDRHGHAAGDRVLTTVAHRLRDRVPGVVARLGGDEFAALLAHPDPAVVARRVAEAVAVPVALADGTSVRVTASVGVAAGDGPDLPTALACADAAMYRAKTTRTTVAVYHPRLDDRPTLAGDPRPTARVRELPTTEPTTWEVAA